MNRNFSISIYPEPIEFSLSFDVGTPDEINMSDKAVSIENFLGRLKAAGWEVEKGTAAQVDPDEKVSWSYELLENSQAFDGDRGASCKEDARENALSALGFILEQSGDAAGSIEIRIIQDFYREIENKAYKGHVSFIERRDEQKEPTYFIMGEEPHEDWCKYGINTKYSQPFNTFEEAISVFDKICSSTKLEDFVDHVWDPETFPREISLAVWPETGAWCSKDILAEKLAAGESQKYVCIEVLEAASWNPKTMRIERELDQGYYMSIEVQEFLKDFEHVNSSRQNGMEQTLEREYAYAIKKLNEYQMKSVANTIKGSSLEDALGNLKTSVVDLKI